MSEETKYIQHPSTIRNSEHVAIALRFDSNNYPLWSRLMRVAFASRGKTSHITSSPPPPSTEDPAFAQWEESDMTVFSWIIHNMEGRLVSNFAQHSTAKALWDSITTTYEIGTDPFQVYDLEVRANKVSQGQRSIEDYWAELQSLWISIDRQQPDPLRCCEKGINQYRRITDNRRLYQFLSGLDDGYDGVRRDILKVSPTPSAETAYGTVRREAARINILKSATSPATGVSDSSSGGVGLGFGVRNQGQGQRPQQTTRGPPPPPNRGNPPRSGQPSSRNKIDKSKLWCSHCGKQKHTKESCFHLVGFPDWWDENQAKGRAAVGIDGE